MSTCAVLKPADVGVVLVNYRSASDTLACLDALAYLSAPPRRIVVVENGSGDGSNEKLSKVLSSLKMKPQPELLSLGQNLGFSGGNNAALRLLLEDSNCRAFWLVNNDTMPELQSLEALCIRLSEQKRPGAVGSLLIHARGDRIVQCAAGGSLCRLFGTTVHLLEGMPQEEALTMPPKEVEAKLDYICGASLLVTREAVECVGLLDETYFLYYEDVDWGIRLRRSGFDLGYASQSVVLHKEGGSTGAVSRSVTRQPERSACIDYLALRNRIRFMREFLPFYLPFVLASFIGVIFNRLRRRQKDRIKLVLRAAWDGLTGRMGPPSDQRWQP